MNLLIVDVIILKSAAIFVKLFLVNDVAQMLQYRDIDLRLQQLIIELRKKDESCKNLEITNEDLSSQTRRLQVELTELKSRFY